MNGALRWGSSKHGKAFRAVPGPNTVAASNLQGTKMTSSEVEIKHLGVYKMSPNTNDGETRLGNCAFLAQKCRRN